MRHFGWFGHVDVPIIESTAFVEGLTDDKGETIPERFKVAWAKRLERGTTGAVFVSCRGGHTSTCVHATPIDDLTDFEL